MGFFKFFASSRPRVLASSRPRVLASSRPRVLASLLFLVMMFFANLRVSAQVGSFALSPFTTNATTGITTCTLGWSGNSVGSAFAIQITVSINGVQPFCIRTETASPSPTVFGAEFPLPGFQRTVGLTSAKIERFGSAAFQIPMLPSIPIIISFHAAPGTTRTINATGQVKPNSTGGFIPIGSATRTEAVDPGITLVGDLLRPTWSMGCIGASSQAGLGITNVTTNLVANNGTECFPMAANMSTFEDGEYHFTGLPTGFNYTITPTKSPIETEFCCGVTANDIVAGQKFVLNIGTLNVAEQIAADFNANGFVTTFDLVEMRKCVLGISGGAPPGWTPWRFVPFSTFIPTDPAFLGNLNTIASSITGPPFQIPPNNPTFPATSFWGVKRGDVDGDCLNCGDALTNGSTDRATNGQVVCKINEQQLEKGQVFDLPIFAPLNGQTRFWGAELWFDPEKVDVLGVENGDFSEEYAMSAISSINNYTSVRFDWMTMDADAAHVESEKTVMFKIRLMAKTRLTKLSDAIRTPTQSKLNNYYAENGQAQIQYRFNQPTQSFSAKMVGSNLLKAADSELQVEVELPEHSTIRATLIDNHGDVVESRLIDGVEGFQNLTFDKLPAQSGIYIIQLQTDFGNRLLRFVKY